MQYFSLFLVFILISSSNANASVKKPKLILQITVDQLRGDLLYRYQDRFVKGGFNYFLNEGVIYRDAHHGHANTETIVGHVTLATGTYPSAHGLVGNIWFDRQQGKTVYNIEDANYSLLTKGADVDKSTEVDPTQKAANVDGRSPNSINASTFSDELIVGSAGKAKVFGVSIKDRGAVAMAGHGGKALWFSKATQEFVSSDFYYQEYPHWVKEWNAQKKPGKYANHQWQLLNEKSSYIFAEQDDNQWEGDIGGYGRVFPHPFGALTSPYFSTLLTISPVGDDLTSDFAKTLIINENIGQDDITDYLSISYSSTDYVGHFYGMSSLESEDNLLRLDKNLADLLSFVDKNIGLENTLIVLSADHGGPEAPGYLHEMHLKGDYVSPKKWDDLAPIKAVKKSLGITEQLIQGYHHPYVYLDHALIKKHKLSLSKVQSEVAQALAKLDDIHRVVESHKVENNLLTNTKINSAIANNYYPGRSGDIYIIFKPQDFINDLDGLKVASVHGSPWTYDTFVPIIFAGNGIKHKEVFHRVETIDIAPTLSAIMRIKPPSASQGSVLKEVLAQ